MPQVIVTHLLTPKDNVLLYRLLKCGTFNREAEAETLVMEFKQALAGLWKITRPRVGE